MEHNLEDTLNLESAIGGIDFENSSDVVVSQADITLDTVTHDEDIPMEFEHIEEQPLLMDTESEEIIVSDFMSDQFSLQEYSVQDDQTTTTTTTEESNQNVLTSQSDTVIDLQFDALTSMPVKQDSNLQPKYIAIKAAPDRVGAKKSETVAGGPRQIAIAPKLPKLVPMGARQYTLAPKPVALITNTSSGLKKVPLNAAPKGNAVLAQIGKQLVVMPPGSPKIKLVTSGSTSASNIQYIKTNSSQAQLVTSKSVQGGKPIMAKVIVQGQYNTDAANQQTVITKLLPTTSCVTPQTRYVMQQKTVPISLGNKVLLASPTKQGMKFAKKQQIIAIKSPTPKLMPAPTQASTTKKVVITANPSQNVILKTTAPPKAGQVSKDGKVVVQNQRSQLHQINVPGKGIQYIRLITNQTSGTSKTLPKTLTAVSGPPKSFVLTDNKGNLIQMSAEKMNTGQPPPLVFTGDTAPVSKWQQKLVRLAPLVSKPSSVTVTTSASRSAQSLLAPLSPMDVNVEASEMIKQEQQVSESSYPQSPVQDEDTNSMEPHESEENLEEQLIVIPSNFGKVEDATDDCSQEEGTKFIENLNFETEVVEHSPSPVMPLAVSDCETSTDLGLRARRACNCTKSQCLKLYCDCFANGEFCNKCNCTNCYNNLDHEELRQKAIRACLERNPNAFRPKIGKSKAGGPEIIRRHNKGCNCKRSGCLKNYCECYEAKIACTAMCKCFGCRNVEESLHRGRRRDVPHPLYRPPPLPDLKQPCSFMTAEVIEAVCQCLIAASVNGGGEGPADPVRDVIDEFSRCLQDIIGASHHAPPEGNT